MSLEITPPKDQDAIHDNEANEISAITQKGTPVNGDLLIIEDSAASFVKKYIEIGDLPGGGGNNFADDVFRIQDDGDATKEIAFQASGITTSTTRTITVPDADLTLLVPAGLTGGQTINGGTADNEDLNLNANTAAYVDGDDGRIRIGHPIVFTNDFTVASANLSENVMLVDTAITSNVAVNLFAGYSHDPTLTMSVAQTVTQAPAFSATPNYIHPTAITDSLAYYMGFTSSPSYNPTHASGTATATNLIGYNSQPVIKPTTSNGVVTSVACFGTNLSQVFLGSQLNANASITNYYHYQGSGAVGSTASITNEYIFHSEAQNGLGPVPTNKYVYSSAMADTSTTWNLYLTGTAKSFMRGGLRIGDSTPTQPTEKLEVLGNIYLDNGGSSGELRIREPSGGGSSYFGLKAGALSGNTVYTTPTGFPASSGDVLSCTTGGVMSWTTPGAGSSKDGGQVTGGVNGLAGSATEGCSYGGHAACNQGPTMPLDGEVYAITIANNAARSAGTATAQWKKNGAVQTGTAVLDGTNTQYKHTVIGTPVTFSAGDRVDLEVVTSSWNPTGSDPTVCIFWRET